MSPSCTGCDNPTKCVGQATVHLMIDVLLQLLGDSDHHLNIRTLSNENDNGGDFYSSSSPPEHKNPEWTKLLLENSGCDANEGSQHIVQAHCEQDDDEDVVVDGDDVVDDDDNDDDDDDDDDDFENGDMMMMIVLVVQSASTSRGLKI